MLQQGLVESNAVNAAKIAQDKQLRLSVATPLLAALIQGEATIYASMVTLLTATGGDAGTIQLELSSSRAEQIETVKAALEYADLLIKEVHKQQ